MTLGGDDLAQIERLLAEHAERIADLVAGRPPTPPEIVAVEQLVESLGVSTASVYEHADALGVSRIGGALRFDVAEAVRRTRRSWPPTLPAAPPPRRVMGWRPDSSIPLLPIGGKRENPEDHARYERELAAWPECQPPNDARR